MRLALFVLGLLLIPVCSGLMRMLHVLAVHYPAKAAVPILSLSAPVGAFLIGALLFTTIFMVVRFPAAPYIWVHELTHALFGLLSGSTVSRLVVDKEHGSVDITSPTMIGLLAPYFFPLPALIFLLLSSILSFALPVGGTVAGGAVSSALGRRRPVFILGAAGAAGSLALLLVAKATPLLLLGIAVFGFMYRYKLPALQTAMTELPGVTPAIAAGGYGLMFGIGYVLGIFTPRVMSAVTQAFGMEAAMLLFAGLMAVSAVISCGIRETGPRAARPARR